MAACDRGGVLQTKRRKIFSLFALCPLILGSAALSGLAGCGSGNDGPPRYDVQGKVFYGSEPVRTGRITFMPDYEKGNKGPSGYAVIKDGIYDTSASGGKAVIAGPATVLISGYEPPQGASDTNPEAGIPKPLFEDYKMTAEINPEQSRSVLDFTVPIPAKKR